MTKTGLVWVLWENQKLKSFSLSVFQLIVKQTFKCLECKSETLELLFGKDRSTLL